MQDRTRTSTHLKEPILALVAAVRVGVGAATLAPVPFVGAGLVGFVRSLAGRRR